MVPAGSRPVGSPAAGALGAFENGLYLSFAGRGYGLGAPLSVLAEEIGKVSYPGLDLSHLHS